MCTGEDSQQTVKPTVKASEDGSQNWDQEVAVGHGGGGFYGATPICDDGL